MIISKYQMSILINILRVYICIAMKSTRLRREPRTFNHLIKLNYLELNNKISSIPSTIFLGLTNLEKVYLLDNPVYDIYGQEYLQSL